jgi:hypothetical protein
MEKQNHSSMATEQNTLEQVYQAKETKMEFFKYLKTKWKYNIPKLIKCHKSGNKRKVWSDKHLHWQRRKTLISPLTYIKELKKSNLSAKVAEAKE